MQEDGRMDWIALAVAYFPIFCRLTQHAEQTDIFYWAYNESVTGRREMLHNVTYMYDDVFMHEN